MEDDLASGGGVTLSGAAVCASAKEMDHLSLVMKSLAVAAHICDATTGP